MWSVRNVAADLAGAVLEDGVDSLTAQGGLQRDGLDELLALAEVDRLDVQLTRTTARGSCLSHRDGRGGRGEEDERRGMGAKKGGRVRQ